MKKNGQPRDVVSHNNCKNRKRMSICPSIWTSDIKNNFSLEIVWIIPIEIPCHLYLLAINIIGINNTLQRMSAWTAARFRRIFKMFNASLTVAKRKRKSPSFHAYLTPIVYLPIYIYIYIYVYTMYINHFKTLLL